MRWVGSEGNYDHSGPAHAWMHTHLNAERERKSAVCTPTHLRKSLSPALRVLSIRAYDGGGSFLRVFVCVLFLAVCPSLRGGFEVDRRGTAEASETPRGLSSKNCPEHFLACQRLSSASAWRNSRRKSCARSLPRDSHEASEEPPSHLGKRPIQRQPCQFRKTERTGGEEEKQKRRGGAEVGCLSVSVRMHVCQRVRGCGGLVFSYFLVLSFFAGLNKSRAREISANRRTRAGGTRRGSTVETEEAHTHASTHAILLTEREADLYVYGWVGRHRGVSVCGTTRTTKPWTV